MVLLDTCTLIWLVSNQKLLSQTAHTLLQDNRGALFVSAISAFEIGVKVRKKKLILTNAAEIWYPRALELHGLREISLDGQLLLRATALPKLHKDPADRIIIATAISHNCTILTPDPKFEDYDAQVVW